MQFDKNVRLCEKGFVLSCINVHVHEQADQSTTSIEKEQKVPFCACMLTDRDQNIHFTVTFKANKQVSEDSHTNQLVSLNIERLGSPVSYAT